MSIDPNEHFGWRLRAACRDRDPALWFPAQSGIRTIRMAKAICSRCPVRIHCLREALGRGDLEGIWGGRTAEERRRIRRRLRG